MKRGGVKVDLFLVVVLGVCLIPVILVILPIRLVGPRVTIQQAFPGMARADMEGIFTAAMDYANTHGGQFPPDLETVLNQDLFKTLTPEGKDKLRKEVVYFGANRVYDWKDGKTVFAKYRWPLVGEATMYDSKKVEAIVYGKKEMVVYDGNESQDSGRRHEVLK